MKKLFVWDYHGTMEEGNECAVLEFSNLALKNLGFSERFSQSEINELYGKKWPEMFKYILPDLPDEMHEGLYRDARKLSDTHPDIMLQHIMPTENLYGVLDKIVEHNHEQILISNMSSQSSKKFIDAIRIGTYFQDENIFPTIDAETGEKMSKNDVLRQYLIEKSFEDIILIGDSCEDVGMKSVAGGVSYLYSHPGKPFRDCDADYKIRDLRWIQKEI